MTSRTAASLMFLAAFAAGAFAQANEPMLLDDFSNGNDDRWSHIDRSDSECDAPATFDASTGVYRIESGCALPAGDRRSMLGATYIGITDPVYDSGFARAKFEFGNQMTSMWLGLRSPQNAPDRGYRFRVSPHGSLLSITRAWEHDSEVILAAKLTTDTIFEPGDTIWVEAGAVGRKLSIKVWKDGDLEPKMPHLVTSDPIYQYGNLSIGMDNESSRDAMVAGRFDDVYFQHNQEGDLDYDGRVGVHDIYTVLIGWGECAGCHGDADGDGMVDWNDLQIVLANWTG